MVKVRALARMQVGEDRDRAYYGQHNHDDLCKRALQADEPLDLLLHLQMLDHGDGIVPVVDCLYRHCHRQGQCKGKAKNGQRDRPDIAA